MSLDIEELCKEARRCPEAKLIVLFGSVARGQAQPTSDADIGVLGAPFWRGLEVGSAIAGKLHREPHVVELDRASDWLCYEIARDGILLAEGEPLAWVNFRAEAMLRYFDLRPIIERCAEGVRRQLEKGAADG